MESAVLGLVLDSAADRARRLRSEETAAQAIEKLD